MKSLRWASFTLLTLLPAIGVAKSSLVVGGAKGLFRVDYNGRVLSRLASRPADHPRYLGSDIYFIGKKPFGLYRYRRGKIKLIGRLPTCASFELDVQEVTGFVFSADRKLACISLLDANVNNSHVWIDVRVDLAKRTVIAEDIVGDKSCKIANRSTRKLPACTAPSATIGQQARSNRRYPYRLGKEGRLLRRGQKGAKEVLVRRLLAEKNKEPPYFWLESGRGRWSLLAGNQNPPEDADQVHRQLLLLDRKTGAIFPLRQDAGKWQQALTDKQLGKLDYLSLRRHTRDVIAESTVRWLAKGVLLVDTMLYLPPTKVVQLPGRVAW